MTVPSLGSSSSPVIGNTKEVSLVADDVKRIVLLGKGLYRYWALRIIQSKFAENLRVGKSPFELLKREIKRLKLEKSILSERQESSSSRRVISPIPKEILSGSLQEWCETHAPIFNRLAAENTDLRSLEETFLIVKRFSEQSPKLQLLERDIADSLQRLRVFTDKTFAKPHSDGISGAVSILFPRFVLLLTKQSPLFFEFNPDSPDWKTQLLWLEEFGNSYEMPALGKEVEDYFFKTLETNAYYPVAGELFTRKYGDLRKGQTPLIEEAISPLKESVPEISPVKEIVKAPEIVLPTIDPLLGLLTTGFSKLSIQERVKRWIKVDFEAKPSSTTFPEYQSATPEEWKRALIKHRMPAYLLFALGDEIKNFANFSETEGVKRAFFNVTLKLPNGTPIQGRIVVSANQKNEIFHNYFETDLAEEALDEAFAKMAKFVPIDTFGAEGSDLVAYNFRFRNEEKGVFIEDTRSGIETFFARTSTGMNRRD